MALKRIKSKVDNETAAEIRELNLPGVMIDEDVERTYPYYTLARVTGIRASTINDKYNEFAERISLNHLDRICKALNCDISDILEYIPDEP